ncbi:GON-4-like protein [Diadema antillarum]|uniref:GON-4-like protein n=1 Tax=Diadema antillarum TaxID=105358 RepID=UPI003A83B4E8
MSCDLPKGVEQTGCSQPHQCSANGTTVSEATVFMNADKCLGQEKASCSEGYMKATELDVATDAISSKETMNDIYTCSHEPVATPVSACTENKVLVSHASCSSTNNSSCYHRMTAIPDTALEGGPELSGEQSSVGRGGLAANPCLEDSTVVTESPANSEEGSLVISMPSSTASPLIECIPGASLGEVNRSVHPADLGCEVEITGDCLPSTTGATELEAKAIPTTPLSHECKSMRSRKRKRRKFHFARRKQRRINLKMDHDDDELDESLDLDADLERKLEENAVKNNLTAINVKSILHHVITNEHVLSMVRNTMTDAGLVQIEQEPALYEPKLTRSKLKEASEKVGNHMPYVWPLSPVKNKNKKATPGFIEINFSDDTSDDEDYEPTLDELMKEESDYESVTSQMSDFGSPCASTPPRSVQASIAESELETTPTVELDCANKTAKPSPCPVARHLQVAPIPMGPPPPPVDPERLGDDVTFLRELDAVNKEEATIIAHRTRSKCPIDKPLEAIEASFVAPDAEHDMYDVYESDHEDVEWKKWLAGLFRTEDVTNVDTNDDEQNDPEYNFLAEEETMDKEDYRTDKAVRVSKKELNELLDEVVEAYGDEVDWLEDFDMEKFDQQPQPTLIGNLLQQKQKLSPCKLLSSPAVPELGATTCSTSDSSTLVQSTSTPPSCLPSILLPSVSTPTGQAEAFQSVATAVERAEGQLVVMQPVQQAVCQGFDFQPKPLPALTFGVQELFQLQQQMQQHVQLLCQVHLLTREKPKLSEYAEQSKQFLTELELLACVNEEGVKTQRESCGAHLQFHSNFRSCNLTEALRIVDTPPKGDDVDDELHYKATNAKSTGSRQRPPRVSMEAARIIANNTVFMYSELLPKNGFYPETNNKIIFTLSEDHLIARGLQQFGKFDNKIKLVQSLMMPCKTDVQIRTHIKNALGQRRTNSTSGKQNPILAFEVTRTLPSFPPMCKVVLPQNAVPPVQLPAEKLPRWLQTIQGVQKHMGTAEKQGLKSSSWSPVKSKPQEQAQLYKKRILAVAQSNSLETRSIIITPGMNLAPGGLILQPNQPLLNTGLPSGTVCQVKFVVSSPQDSAISAGDGSLVGSAQLAPAQAVASPAPFAVQNMNTPVAAVPHGAMVSLVPHQTQLGAAAVVPAGFTVNGQTSIAVTGIPTSTPAGLSVITTSQENCDQHAESSVASTGRHVVRSLNFTSSMHPNTTAATASMPRSARQELCSSDNRASSVAGSPTTASLHQSTALSNNIITAGCQEKLSAQESASSESEDALEDDHDCRKSEEDILWRTKCNVTVGELLARKEKENEQRLKKRKLRLKRLEDRCSGFVSMASLAKLGASSLNTFRISGSKWKSKSTVEQRKSPSEDSVLKEKCVVSATCSTQTSTMLDDMPETAITQTEVNEKAALESRQCEGSQDGSSDCIPLEAALKQLEEEEKSSSSQSTNAFSNSERQVTSLHCEESLSHLTLPPRDNYDDVKDDQSAHTDGFQAAAGHDETAHTPTQHILKAGRGDEVSPAMTIADACVPEGTVLSDIQSRDIPNLHGLPTEHQEGPTSRMSETAASVSSNTKVPLELPNEQAEMMVSVATGGKSPTLDEQSSTREFLSCGEQGGAGEDGEEEEEVEVSRRDGVKVAAKRIKSKLRKDLESTVVLLDPEIVCNDPQKDDREFAFAKDYLDRVKDTLGERSTLYADFLKVFNDHDDNPNSSISNLYHRVTSVLCDYPGLVEEFTAFMPPEVALQCGVLLECLEFSKARLFLRQVEVHFHKHPVHIQKIVKTLVEWGETQRNYSELKDALTPLLKGQPHLEQELSMLFPDSRPPENYMMDFEEVSLGNDSSVTHDGFEEIELPASDDEEDGNTSKLPGFGAAKKNMLDPWKGLNDELQYGTRSCKCNCHETSQDWRVQRKARHCAYCSAMVTRAELISSLRRLCPGRRRNIRDGGSSSRRGGGGGRNGKRRARGSKAEDAEKEGEEDEGVVYPYSEAVNHLSQICDNLADYLQDNTSATEDEDEAEEDEEGGEENEHEDEEEDHDDGDDELDDDGEGNEAGDEEEDEMDVANDEDEDENDVDGNELEEEENEDVDIEEDEDEEGRGESSEDDEAEEEGDNNRMTSGESNDELGGDQSPYTSQGSHDTAATDLSNSGSPMSTSPASSQTTLLTGITGDTDSRSVTSSPTKFQQIKDKESSTAITDGGAQHSKSSEVPLSSEDSSHSTELRSKDGRQTPRKGREGKAKQETPDTQSPSMDSTPQPGKPETTTKAESAVTTDVSVGETTKGPVWTRVEDKTLLQACQEHGAHEKTFLKVADKLEHKTSQEVRKRFAHLMQLFHFKKGASADEGDNEDDGRLTMMMMMEMMRRRRMKMKSTMLLDSKGGD